MKTKTIILIIILGILGYYGISKLLVYNNVNKFDNGNLLSTSLIEFIPKTIDTHTIDNINIKSSIQFNELIISFPDSIVDIRRVERLYENDAFENKGLEIQFTGGRYFEIYTQNSPRFDFINEFEKKNKDNLKDKLDNLYDEEGITDNYNLLKYSYNLKPSQISIFESNDKIIAKHSLLVLKKYHLYNDVENSFYNIESEFIKCFIFGNDITNNIVIDGFTSSGTQYMISSSGFEINEILPILNKIKTKANNTFHE